MSGGPATVPPLSPSGVVFARRKGQLSCPFGDRFEFVWHHQLVAGDLIGIDGALATFGNKSVTFELDMLHEHTGNHHASYEITEVFFDPEVRSSAEMPASVRSRLERLL